MQPYPRSPDLVWPGHLHGTGCLSARADGTGFPTFVRRWVWVLLTPPVLAGVLGGCVWARFVVLSLLCRLSVVFVVGVRLRPAFGSCVVAWAPRLPPAVSGSGVRCGRVCWARVSAVPSPSWLGSRGVFFALFFSWVFLSRALWSLSSHPLSFGLGYWISFFFFFFVCATPCHSWLGFAAGGGGRSPPLLAGVRWRRCCVVCGGGVLVGLWLVCGVVGPSPLLAAVPVCYSPPLLAGFRCRWWWTVPATPGWGPLAAVVCGLSFVVFGVWRWCVGGVAAGVWCGWSLATPGGGSCVLLPATPGWVSLPVVVGGPRHSWLGSAGGGGV